MKNVLLLTAVLAVLAGASVSLSSCGSRRPAQASDTLRVNTTESGADIMGFNGPTPLEITVVKGVVTEIKALPNQETPRFLRHVLESGLLSRLDGMTVKEARRVRLDAVSGATFTSRAMIQNIQLGLESADSE